jgi:catechol 2,3-dioxygenase-like lactoylglutathione lyase family enzyme
MAVKTHRGKIVLNIESVNHVGIRVSKKDRSIEFYSLLGFDLITDVGFEKGHPVIMKHPSGVVLNLLGPASDAEASNILMDVDKKHTGITHVALTVSSLEDAKNFMEENAITITGSFSFGNMSAIFIRDPDRSVIELDAYGGDEPDDMGDYSNHP